MTGQFQESQVFEIFWVWTLMEPICMLLRHGICSYDMLYALGTWFVPLGHNICSWDTVYAPGTCYMLLGHCICSWDMLYALGKWYMLYGYGICSMDMLRYDILRYSILWYDMLCFLKFYLWSGQVCTYDKHTFGCFIRIQCRKRNTKCH